jgi:hypothetical protein
MMIEIRTNSWEMDRGNYVSNGESAQEAEETKRYMKNFRSLVTRPSARDVSN